jgi:hypothetical protein
MPASFLKQVDLVQMDITAGPFLSKQTQIAETRIGTIPGTVESRRQGDRLSPMLNLDLIKVCAGQIEFIVWKKSASTSRGAPFFE